jgi:hypothetical protein
MLSFEQFEVVETGTTADPSASLGMTKERVVFAPWQLLLGKA